MDDSEVSLNVCLGKQFSGGELYFRGVRCDHHVNSESGENVFLLILSQPQRCFSIDLYSESFNS